MTPTAPDLIARANQLDVMRRRSFRTGWNSPQIVDTQFFTDIGERLPGAL
jgi:hypothetical protein